MARPKRQPSTPTPATGDTPAADAGPVATPPTDLGPEGAAIPEIVDGFRELVADALVASEGSPANVDALVSDFRRLLALIPADPSAEAQAAADLVATVTRPLDAAQLVGISTAVLAPLLDAWPQE